MSKKVNRTLKKIISFPLGIIRVIEVIVSNSVNWVAIPKWKFKQKTPNLQKTNEEKKVKDNKQYFAKNCLYNDIQISGIK